jgi:hypothetical protein
MMAKMTVAERRDHVLKLLSKRNRYQFGQPDSGLVSSSGCTDTCIQLIVWMALGKRVSLNLVRRRSGAPAQQPMEIHEALRALRSFGLPYIAIDDFSSASLVGIARARGPVILCEKYWSHPQWQGYRYLGKRLDGTTRTGQGRKVTVGFSRPFKRSGLSQWNFRDGHAVLLGTDDYRDVGRPKPQHFAVVRDPNHNSASRPERPAYDLVTLTQLRRMIDSWSAGRLAMVPTRPVIK